MFNKFSDPKGLGYFNHPKIKKDLISGPTKAGLANSFRCGEYGTGFELLLVSFGILFLFFISAYSLKAFIFEKVPGLLGVVIVLGYVFGCLYIIGQAGQFILNIRHKTIRKKCKLWTEDDVNLYFKKSLGSSPYALQDFKGLGVKKFCEKYFNKSGPGFVRFMEEKINLDDKFLNFALSVPKKKELSVDSLRKILAAYSGEVWFSRSLDLELAFSNYSLLEIETIFTNPGSRKVLFNLDSTPLLVCNSFNSLAPKGIPNSLIQLENLKGEFTFKVLKTQAEYDRISDDFSNCVRGMFKRHLFIVVAKSERGETCIEFDSNLTIAQMAGPKNSVSEDRIELSLLLKSKGFQVRRFLPNVGGLFRLG